MVNNITSLTGNGLKDWLIQRVTAVFLTGYVFYLFGYFLIHPSLDYSQWHLLFTYKFFQITTIVALLALILHAWIGIWTVTTDYFKCTYLRLSLQLLVALMLLSQFIWGLFIVWGQ